MNGLMLHCGGLLKSRDEVFGVAVPEATASYQPLAHASFITRIEKQLAVEGIRVKDEKLALAKNGQRFFGLMELDMPQFPTADFSCVIGLRNSYDKSCSTGLAIGASVFVCDNLSFSGDVKFERKHTANLLRDLQWVITETVTSLPSRFATQSATFDRYKRYEIGDRQAHDLIIRLFDAGVFNLTDIRKVLTEWRTPQHPEFAQSGKTAWRLFNATTQILKSDLWSLTDRTRILHQVLDTEIDTLGEESAFTVPIRQTKIIA